jgi:putative membrane protein
MHYYWFNGSHMIWMTISWLVGIGLFSMFVWLLVSTVNRGPGSGPSPEEILRRRYAAGEIETEEYERRLEELRKTKDAA